MKKFLLMLAMLLPCVGAWAQPQTSDAPADGQWAANTQWFIMTNGHGNLVSKNISDANGNLKLTQTTTTEATDDLLWCVVGNTTDGYTFYNKAAGTEKVLGLTGNEANARANFVAVGADNYVTAFDITASTMPGGYWCMKDKGSDNNYWNKRGNYLAKWNSAAATNNDKGSAYLFTPVSLDDIKDYTYQSTDNYGNIYEGTCKLIKNNTSLIKPIVVGAAGTVSDYTWNEDIYTSTINFKYPMSKVDGATNETLLAQFGNKYWHANDNSVKVQTTSVAAIDANCLWAIYPTCNNGVFTFAIMNVVTGKYIHTDNTSGAHNTQNTITLSDEPTMFTIASDKDWKVVGKELYLSINSTNDTNVWLGLYGSAHNGTDVSAVALTEYKVNVTDAKYATFYAPIAVTVPNGITAHTVTINGDWATLSKALTTIPAYTGVVLYSENAGTYTFAVTNEQVDAIEDNALAGTVATSYITEPAYVLSNVDGAGFYAASMNQKGETAFLNNHHKAYLPASVVTSNTKALRFIFGGTTAIESVINNNANAPIYDLSGRRVNNAVKGGIYIQNGKKFIVK